MIAIASAASSPTVHQRGTDVVSRVKARREGRAAIVRNFPTAKALQKRTGALGSFSMSVRFVSVSIRTGSS